MKRQTRPFVVEVKQSKRGPGKPVVKPLWSGRDLDLLRDAQPDEANDLPETTAPVRRPEVRISTARVLPALTMPDPIDEAPVEAPVEIATRPVAPAPKVRKRVSVAKPISVAKPFVVAVAAEPAPIAPQPEIVDADAAVVPSKPARARNRAADELPPGQRWKRRLPKALR